MQQVCGGVVAHRRLTDVGVDDGIDSLSDADRLLCDNLMRPHTLDRRVASGNFGDDGVVIIGVEPSAIADLAAGLGVERRVVEDDLSLIAGLEFLRALAALDDGEDFAVFGPGLAVAFELSADDTRDIDTAAVCSWVA